MPWADRAEARLRTERRILGLSSETTRTLRLFIERKARQAGRSIVTVDMVKRYADAWVTGEGDE